MKHKAMLLLVMVLLLAGCNAEVEEENHLVIEDHAGNYSHVIPFESNHNRFHHATKDGLLVGEGLVEMAKEYFPTDAYDIQEGLVIDEYESEFLPLILRRESKENPIGLNPSRNTELDLGKGQKIKGPFIFYDLYEVNFFEKGNADEMAGIAIALVVHDTIEDSKGRIIEIDKDVLYEIAINSGRKLESYLRKNTEVGDIPLLISIFSVNPYNQSKPGNFIAKGYFENRKGQFEKVKHSWEVFPLNNARDKAVNSQILNMKKAVDGFIPEDIGIVAYGEYRDEKLHQLIIDASIQAKTYTEVSMISNTLAELIMNFETNSDVLVRIKQINETIVLIEKPVGKKVRITRIGM